MPAAQSHTLSNGSPRFSFLFLSTCIFCVFPCLEKINSCSVLRGET